MSGPLFGIFDACDDDAFVLGNFASYDDADRVAAAMRKKGQHGIWASELCDQHGEEPAAGCEACEHDDADDEGTD